MKKIKQTTTFDPEHPYPIAPEPSNAPAQWDALGGDVVYVPGFEAGGLQKYLKAIQEQDAHND